MIKIFPTIQIKELDAYTIENEPIASIDLMERASQALAKAISERWGAETPFTVFAGPGNNGGDALAVSRLLAEQGYRVEVYLFNTKGTLSPDCETNKERLARVSGIDFHEITTQFVPPVLTAEHVVVDGLFGSGLNKPLSGGFAAVVKYINSSPATVVAIDVPSGLMGEDNTYNIQANIIRADLTLSLQLPKLAFLFAENEPFVGEWQLLDIGLSEEAITEKETDFRDERAFYEAVSYHPVFEYTGGTAQKTVIAYDENNQATAASVEYSVLKDICVTDKKDDYEKICSYCMPRSQIYDCMCSLAASFFYNGKCS